MTTKPSEYSHHLRKHRFVKPGSECHRGGPPEPACLNTVTWACCVARKKKVLVLSRCLNSPPSRTRHCFSGHRLRQKPRTDNTGCIESYILSLQLSSMQYNHTQCPFPPFFTALLQIRCQYNPNCAHTPGPRSRIQFPNGLLPQHSSHIVINIIHRITSQVREVVGSVI